VVFYLCKFIYWTLIWHSAIKAGTETCKKLTNLCSLAMTKEQPCTKFRSKMVGMYWQLWTYCNDVILIFWPTYIWYKSNAWLYMQFIVTPIANPLHRILWELVFTCSNYCSANLLWFDSTKSTKRIAKHLKPIWLKYSSRTEM